MSLAHSGEYDNSKRKSPPLEPSRETGAEGFLDAGRATRGTDSADYSGSLIASATISAMQLTHSHS